MIMKFTNRLKQRLHLFDNFSLVLLYIFLNQIIGILYKKNNLQITSPFFHNCAS